MDITINIELLIAIGFFLSPIIVVGARYFWNKSKCFIILEQKVESQEESTKKGIDDHEKIFGRLNNLDKNVHLIMGAMKLKPVD